MNTQTTGQHRSHPGKTGVLAIMSCAGLIGILLVAAVSINFSAAPPSRPAGPGPLRYFGDGRWRADAWTLVFMVRYLFEPEPAVPRGIGVAPLELAMPTNAAPALPKA